MLKISDLLFSRATLVRPRIIIKLKTVAVCYCKVVFGNRPTEGRGKAEFTLNPVGQRGTINV